MSKQNGALKKGDLQEVPSDDNPGFSSTAHRSSLPATSILRPENSLPVPLTASPDSPNDPNRLSSPSIRAFARQQTTNKLQNHQNRRGTFTEKASILSDTINRATSKSSHGGSATRSSVHVLPRNVAAIGRSASTLAGPRGSFLNSSSDSSFVRIEKSKGPASRKRAIPTRPFVRNQRRRVSSRGRLSKSGRAQKNSSSSVKPFEIFETVEAQLRTSHHSLEFCDDLRRLQLAISIDRNVKASMVGRPSLSGNVLRRQPPTPGLKHLALGKLVIVDDRGSCSFCMFECYFGTSNEEILLPASASCHRCVECQDTRFFDEEYMKTDLHQASPSGSVSIEANHAPLELQTASNYHIFIKPVFGDSLALKVESSNKVLDVKNKLSRIKGIKWDLHHLFSGGAMLKDNWSLSECKIGPKALLQVTELKSICGRDVTQFWKPLFCSGCPWRQVDVKLAKICMPCRKEKFAILKHRHGAWTPFFNTAHVDDAVPTPMHRHDNCMICTDLARMKCSECPLVVCVNCSAHLEHRCKGSLDLLLYSYAQEHIRNDAFLLRSDGGGF